MRRRSDRRAAFLDLLTQEPVVLGVVQALSPGNAEEVFHPRFQATNDQAAALIMGPVFLFEVGRAFRAGE